MSRAVWVDAGNDPDYAKLALYGITRPYFDCRDPRLTPAYLDGVRAHDCEPGIFAAWNWEPALTGPQFAEWIDAQLRRIGWLGNPSVCADIEKGSGLTDANYVTYVLAFLKRWRQLRPKRQTDWTLEGYQGGLFRPGDTIAIAASGVGVYPQAYTGSMQPFDPVDVVLNLCSHSFAPGTLGVMYDAAQLTPSLAWSGYAFTMGRLR